MILRLSDLDGIIVYGIRLEVRLALLFSRSYRLNWNQYVHLPIRCILSATNKLSKLTREQWIHVTFFGLTQVAHPN